MQFNSLAWDGDGPAGPRLSRVLRAVRRHRAVRPTEAAAAMCMPLRSYEHFEAGAGRLNLGRIHQFAAALDCDPIAIVAAVLLDAPQFAVRCADNKLMYILFLSLQDFDAASGDGIARLEPRTLISAFDRLFAHLAAEAARKDHSLEAWLQDRLRRRDTDPKDGEQA